MELKKDGKYTKESFGIKDIMRSEHIVEGKLLTFLNINKEGSTISVTPSDYGNYDNFFHEGGIVYQVRAPYVLIPKGEKAEVRRHIFVRYNPGDDYTYAGQAAYEERFDDDHNKVFF